MAWKQYKQLSEVNKTFLCFISVFFFTVKAFELHFYYGFEEKNTLFLCVFWESLIAVSHCDKKYFKLNGAKSQSEEHI